MLPGSRPRAVTITRSTTSEHVNLLPLCVCPLQVMKIDVEGYELEVLKGARHLLARHTVKYIMMECNTGLITPGQKLEYLR